MTHEEFKNKMIEQGRKSMERLKIYHIPETGCPSEGMEWTEIDIEEVNSYFESGCLSLHSVWEHEGITGLVLALDSDCGIPGLFIPIDRLIWFDVLVSLNYR